MEKSLQNYEQESRQGKQQVVIIAAEETAETDQLDPRFAESDKIEPEKEPKGSENHHK